MASAPHSRPNSPTVAPGLQPDGAPAIEPKLLPIRDVCRRIGLSSATVYRLISAGTFPRPVKIGGRGARPAARWVTAEVDRWIEQQIAASGR